MWQFWLIASGIFFVIEMITVGFMIFWLGVAALLTMLVSFFVDNIIIQATIFVISSALLLFITKPFVDKFVNKDKVVPTNVYSIVGKKGIVIEPINTTNGTGLVKVGGETWSAKFEDDTVIPKGSEIEVVDVQGVKLLVKPINISQTIN